jgi:ribosomal protein S16
MAAMRDQTLRNQMRATNPAEAGSSETAVAEAPVAPGSADSDTNNVEPEVDEPEAEYAQGQDDVDSPEEVTTTDSTAEEIIDFIDFAETNPDAKFKFVRNGKEIVIDAKKAASILGQGAAISEDARQLKIERAEFDEYLNTKRGETEGLLLAMQFTVQPQIQRAYDEIVKTQEYQNTFAQQLANTYDPAAQARIRANMDQNEKYIATQAAVVNQLKPQIDQFYDIRKQQVNEVLESTRKSFKDKELRNDYVFKEIREKIAAGWAGANNQMIPGIPNIDLISSDEHILSLMRDGLKYRNKPTSKQAGGSIAALTHRRGASLGGGKGQSDIESLRDKAKGGDKKAADNVLVAQLQNLRAARGAKR